MIAPSKLFIIAGALLCCAVRLAVAQTAPPVTVPVMDNILYGAPAIHLHPESRNGTIDREFHCGRTEDRACTLGLSHR